MERADDFAERRSHLIGLSDAELRDRFWSLINQLIDPILEEGRTHTSPSIERSVVMRMGFSTIEAKAIVDAAAERGKLGHGVGKIILETAQREKLELHEAGRALAEGRLW